MANGEAKSERGGGLGRGVRTEDRVGGGDRLKGFGDRSESPLEAALGGVHFLAGEMFANRHQGSAEGDELAQVARQPQLSGIFAQVFEVEHDDGAGLTERIPQVTVHRR